jgi:hypothetical protein
MDKKAKAEEKRARRSKRKLGGDGDASNPLEQPNGEPEQSNVEPETTDESN